MKTRNGVAKALLWLGITAWCLSLMGCWWSTQSQQVRNQAEDFWQAIIQEDAKAAQALATPNTVPYLKVLTNRKIMAQRFETGEIQIHDNIAEVATLLYNGGNGDLAIPVRTVLVLTAQGWQVDVQKTMGSMVSGTMSALLEQLNNFLKNDLQDVDPNFAKNIMTLKTTLQKEMDDLQRTLQAAKSRPASTVNIP